MFTLDEAVKAGNEWGANCGPGALAAILGRSLDAVRPALRGFDQKHYTNPAMMRGALRELGAEHVWKVIDLNEVGGWNWPAHGLCRVQWEGPWTKPGVPIAARYRHTHWIGARGGNRQTEIFDINCICASVDGCRLLNGQTKLCRGCSASANQKLTEIGTLRMS